MTHAGYILAAFGLTGLIVAGMLIALLSDYRSLRRELARFADKAPEAET